MKNTIKILLLTTILFLPRVALAAPTGSISCSSKSASVGSNVTITVSGSASEEVLWDLNTYSGDESKLKISGDSRVVVDNFSSSVSKSFTFKAVDTGTVTVNATAAVSGYSGEKATFSGSCTVEVGEGSSSKTETKKEEKTKSSDNSLKSISIEGVKLNPDFNSETLEYNAEIESDEKTKIDIKTEKNDSSATVEGDGEKDAEIGLNKYEITVIAENGSSRVYIINLTVNEKNPITVKVDGKKYKIMRKINGVDAPDGYEKKTIKIKGKEVEVFYNKKIKYTLVVLVDEDNKASLFIYKNGKYTKYNEFSGSNLKLIILKANKKDVPYKYHSTNFEIDGTMVLGYELNDDSRFKLVYALNTETMNKGFYLYDIDEKTFQRFYNDQVNIYIDLVKKFKIGLVVLGVLFSILVVTIICLFVTNHKTKAKINKFTRDRIIKESDE